MSDFDLALGAKVLVGNANWKQASVVTKAAAFLFGRKDSFDHLDVTVQIRWWRDQPYLIGIKEAQS